MSSDTEIPSLGGFGAIFDLLASQKTVASSKWRDGDSPLCLAAEAKPNRPQHQHTDLGDLGNVFDTFYPPSSLPITIPARKAAAPVQSSDDSYAALSSLGEYSTAVSTPPEEDEAVDFDTFVRTKSKQVTWEDEVDVSPRDRVVAGRRPPGVGKAATKRLSKEAVAVRSRSIRRAAPDHSDFESEAEIQTPQRRTIRQGGGVSSPHLASASRLTPAWVKPPSAPQSHFFVPSPLPDIPIQKCIILPISRQSKEEKRRLVVKRFVGLYKEEGSLLETNPAAAISRIGGNTSNKGIHIFVDGSNIVIGHQDILKKTRGLHKSAYTNRPPFSYSCLSLILERGRPVARRILVGSAGSSGQPAWMQEARECGYEVSALERVTKVRETPLKKRHGGNGYGTGQSSGSEAPFLAPVKTNGEQGVDEILHMKMLESIVDYARPATMVLATGDAAEAEYSGGFYKNVKRALEKGWNVELVCWKDGMNSAWKSHEITRWRKQFRIITLDPFGEELLAEYA
jgi:hypothetical protein